MPPFLLSFASGEILAGTTEACVLTLEGEQGKARFRVIDTPAYVSADFDGVALEGRHELRLD